MCLFLCWFLGKITKMVLHEIYWVGGPGPREKFYFRWQSDSLYDLQLEMKDCLLLTPG